MRRGRVAIQAVLALAVPLLAGAASAADSFTPFLGSAGLDSAGIGAPTGADISDIQRRLIALGYDAGPEDGTANPRTRRAIAAWQAAHGEFVTGEPSLDLERRLAAATVLPGPATGPLPAAPDEVARWQRGLIGRPVIGTGGGLVGHITTIQRDAAGAIAGVTVSFDLPGGATREVPLAWPLLAGQVGARVVLLPWSRADLDWLLAGGAAAVPARSLAGRRPSWLDGAEADLEDGGRFGVVDGFLFAADGQVAAIYVRPSPGGPDYPVPRASLRVMGSGPAAHVVIALTRNQVLALLPQPGNANQTAIRP